MGAKFTKIRMDCLIFESYLPFVSFVSFVPLVCYALLAGL